MIREERHHSPRRVVMTIDAVGGIWRYAMDLAAALRPYHVEMVFAGLGPAPSKDKAAEANRIGELFWLDAPLDWMVEGEKEVSDVPNLIVDLARRQKADLLHLNLPSQAANVTTDLPVIVACHSCVATWFSAVRDSHVPQGWEWQVRLNVEGFAHADAVIAPSRSHAEAMEAVYGRIANLQVVHNASFLQPSEEPKQDFVLAAGRWWDDGKNAAVLDRAAGMTRWPVVAAGANIGPTGQFVQFRHADYRGELAHAQMASAMRQAAIVASPSVYEPFGLAALEAARAGAALVLADIPTYRELWEDAALFADPRRPEAFANAFNTLAGDPQQRATLGLKARERSTRFSADAQAEAMRALYSGIFGRPFPKAAE